MSLSENIESSQLQLRTLGKISANMVQVCCSRIVSNIFVVARRVARTRPWLKAGDCDRTKASFSDPVLGRVNVGPNFLCPEYLLRTRPYSKPDQQFI